MPTIEGLVRKMRVAHESPIRYALRLDDTEVPLNEAIGHDLRMTFGGEINCIACGRATRKSFSQGHCFPCSQRLASCDLCIVRPETCHFHKGTCREPEWGEANCMQPHVVYLANSSGVKVGITRRTQLPTRWIDQGATAALPVFGASTRRISGLIEVAIAAHVSDKTDWRRMLKGDPAPQDLALRRDELLELCRDRLAEIRGEFGADSFTALPDDNAIDFRYPVLKHPEKVRSLNFDKSATIEGTLQGIKGQYLILDSGVVNMRRHSGYRIGVDLPG